MDYSDEQLRQRFRFGTIGYILWIDNVHDIAEILLKVALNTNQ